MWKRVHATQHWAEWKFWGVSVQGDPVLTSPLPQLIEEAKQFYYLEGGVRIQGHPTLCLRESTWEGPCPWLATCCHLLANLRSDS